MSQKQKLDLREYRIYGMPLLGMMGLVALGGIVLTILSYFLFH